MPPIDPTSLFAINAISLLVFAAVYLVAWMRGVDRGYWMNLAVSEVILAIAFTMFAGLINGAPQALVLPNVLLVVGLALRWQAMRLFFRQPARMGLNLLAVAVVVAAFLGVSWLGLGLTFAIVNAVLMVQMIVIMLTLLQGEPRLPSRWGLLLAYGVMLLSSAARIGEGVLLRPDMASLLPRDVFLQLHLVAAAIHIVASGAFSLSIAYERGLDELRGMASRDALTNLLNRRGLQEAMINGHMSGCGLAIDIDHFKAINDSHGHPVGDQVIRRCAELVGRAANTGDPVARTGGEEFFVLAQGMDLEQGRLLAERIRAAIQADVGLPGEQRVPFTVSIGVSCGDDWARSYSRWVLEADRALYRAKAEGRNCVRVAG
ncbi:GGDEF domain-containing protein [Frateuria aurantia]